MKNRPNIEDRIKTSENQNDTIKRRRPWIKNYLGDSPLLQLRVVRLEPDQMIESRKVRYHFHRTYLLDNNGNIVCLVGSKENPKPFSILKSSTWKRLINCPESIEEALIRLSEKEREKIAYGVERRIWDTDNSEISLFVYKSPPEYKNFSNFIFTEVAKLRKESDEQADNSEYC